LAPLWALIVGVICSADGGLVASIRFSFIHGYPFPLSLQIHIFARSPPPGNHHQPTIAHLPPPIGVISGGPRAFSLRSHQHYQLANWIYMRMAKGDPLFSGPIISIHFIHIHK